jgi:hypothetical protein
MDANPILCNELRRQSRKMKLHGVKFREIKSHKDDLVQLADYVVSLSTGKARNIPKAAENYRKITKKQIIFVDVRSD